LDFLGEEDGAVSNFGGPNPVAERYDVVIGIDHVPFEEPGGLVVAALIQCDPTTSILIARANLRPRLWDGHAGKTSMRERGPTLVADAPSEWRAKQRRAGRSPSFWEPNKPETMARCCQTVPPSSKRRRARLSTAFYRSASSR
jgi:hypothetical protein